MTDEIISGSADIPDQNSSNEQSEINKKTPFADKPADLSGMVSSVLNPKTEQDRERIQKEILKRQAKLEAKKNASPKTRFYYVRVFLTLIIFCLFIVSLFFVPKAVPVVRKELKEAKNAVKNAVEKEDLKIIKVLSQEKIELDKGLRFTIVTTPIVDKVVVTAGKSVEKQTRYEANLLNVSQKRSKKWEVMAENLEEGEYVYRCYVKDTLSNAYVTVTGNFVIK